MELVKDTWMLYARLARATVRMPIFLIVAVFQPILWMVLFGHLFGAVSAIPGFENSSYVQFLTPGIVIMAALFGSTYSGLGLLEEINRGVLNRLLATPIERLSLVASRIGMSSTEVVLQVAIILGVALLMGARHRGGALGLFWVLLAAVLLAAGLASLSNALVLLTRNQGFVLAVINFVALPATFLSSMIMATELAPAWVQAIARWNPVHWAVVVARDGFEGRAGSSFALHLGLLVAFALICGLLADRALRAYQRSL